LTVQNLFRPLQIGEFNSLNELLSLESTSASQFFSRQGSLLRLNADKEIIAVGDLHGNTARLDLLLEEYGPRLAAGEVSLVFLGDIIHPEELANIRDMRSSLAALNTVVRLKQLFPEQIHFLRGNHDEIRPIDKNRMIIKRGVLQTEVFINYVSDLFSGLGYSRGEVEQMLAAYQSFFENLPLAAVVEGPEGSTFLAHAAVVRGGISQEEAANAYQDRTLLSQLLNNTWKARINQAEPVYVEADAVAMVQRLALRGGPDRTYLIGAHQPEQESGWIYRMFESVNHFIIHGNVVNSFGVIRIQNGLPEARQFVLDQVTAARS
jgi:hypothetical protein